MALADWSLVSRYAYVPFGGPCLCSVVLFPTFPSHMHLKDIPVSLHTKSFLVTKRFRIVYITMFLQVQEKLDFVGF